MLGERLKPARGLPDGDSYVLEARFPYHNFMRGHGGLDGATSAQAAGIEIEGDPWEVLIRNAAIRQR